MTPDEAHRHEWFAGAAAAAAAAAASATTTTNGQPSADEASGGGQKCSEDSEGVFSASSTGSTGSGQPQQQLSNGADRSIMYQIFKSKKNSQQSQQPDEASQQDGELHSPPGAGTRGSNKRIDGNSNLDDSGTYLPSIL